ncbi:MAG: Acyl-CoA dehydrogenase [Syntrophaceae bacterium PtaU1.Bin231]|nr:MAG: Acyl-CoA dehydrogenase [Syntrophaceae bacterium PtaU1.Bin231]
MLGFDLTPEQADIQRKARDFALREVLPLAWTGDARDELPLSLLRKAFEEGISNAGVPREYGGRGYGLLEMVLMVEEVAAACSGVATSIFDNSLGLTPLVLSRNEPLKQHYLSELAREAKWICFATSEPTMGSDVASLRCRVTEQEGGYVLNGTKYWVTNGGIADYISVFATTDPAKGYEGIGGFLAHLDWDGVTRSPPIPKLGQRASNTTGIHFRDVFVPGKNVLAPPGKGFVLAMKTFTRTRPAIGALAVGAARSAMEFALDYARKRQAFGTPLSSFQNTQFRLAEMYQKLETARLLTWKSAWEVDSGMDATTSSAISKMFATEAAWQIADDAMQIMGGYGYTRMFPMEKLLRDIRLLKIYEGTSEIQRLILAGTVLGSYRPVMPSLHDLPVTGIPAPGEDEVGEGVFLWRCRVCGNVHVGREPPESCPYCFFPGSAFKKVVPGQG